VLLEQQGAAACPRETHVETVNANSPSVSSTDIWISLIAFVLIYIALGAADVF
jgi:cytochrome bd-type quinol oxidase subunit 1